MYDVIIIGAGPAGLSAGLYAARGKLKVLIFEKLSEGGQLAITADIENYPGAAEGITGAELAKRIADQAVHFGAEIIKEDINSLELGGQIKKITGVNKTYEARSVIIATGGKARPIGCPGEVELTGKGVSYCATCDADFFTDMEVYVIGGGDSALEEAMYLTKFARKVYVVHRRDEFRAARSIQDKLFKNEKIEVIWDAVVEEIKGDGIVESIVLKNVKSGELTEHKADEEDGTFGIFPFIGFDPVNILFTGQVEMDAGGYIITDADMKTSVPGVFAAGDIRVKSLRQVITAAADGAIAATQAEKYILDKF